MRIYNMLLKTFEIVDDLNPNHLVVINQDEDNTDYYNTNESFEKNPKVFYSIFKKRGRERIVLSADSDGVICKVGLPWLGDLKQAIETWLDYYEIYEKNHHV